MADARPKTSTNGNINLAENIFTATLAFTLEFAIIYFLTTILIFSGLYANVWSIQAVGLMAIFHLIAVPIAYFGVRDDIRLLVLLSILLCSIWFILIIVYVVVFSVQNFDENDFKYRSLHHMVLAFYCCLDIALIIMLSIDIISEKSRDSLRKSLSNSPVAPPTPPQPSPTVTDSKSKKI